MGIMERIKSGFRSVKDKLFGKTEPPKAEARKVSDENPTPPPIDVTPVAN